MSHKSYPLSAFQTYSSSKPLPNSQTEIPTKTLQSLETNAGPRLDNRTSKEGELDYFGVFSPSVLPFKRIAAVGNIQSFNGHVTQKVYTDVYILPRAKKTGHMAHSGDVTLELSPNRKSILPSTAPNMQIVSVETSPSLPIQITKDKEHNFYIESTSLTKATSIQVTYDVLTPLTYLSSLEANDRVFSDAERSSKVGQRWPKGLEIAALNAAAHLGLGSNSAPKEILHRLSRYHRSFSSTDIDLPGPATFEKIFYDQIGVCRHRSMSFWIVANALGLNVQYVSNEAHAWVEVETSKKHWIKIDLGGDAEALHVHNVESNNNNTATAATSSGSSGFSKLVLHPTPEARPAETPKRPLRVYLKPLQKHVFERNMQLDVKGYFRSRSMRQLSRLPVDVFLIPIDQSTKPLLLGRLHSDKKGKFSKKIAIPKDVTVGRFDLIARSPGNDFYSECEY